MTEGAPSPSAVKLGFTPLRMLRAVGETGSFTAAADELGYSQPAVSQHIRRIEAHVGMPVVMRVGQRFHLTQAGEVLVKHSSLALTHLQEADREISDLLGLRTGKVRLIAFRSMCASLVPQVLADLASDHPGITVSLAQNNPEAALEKLARGDAEFAIIFDYGPAPEAATRTGTYVDSDGFTRVPLLVDPIMVALPDTDELAGEASVRLIDLQDHRWIAGMNREYLLRQCMGEGFRADIIHTVDDFLAAHGLVSANLGVALMPGLCSKNITHGGVVMRNLDPVLSRRVELVAGHQVLEQPAARALAESMVRVCAAHQAKENSAP